LPAHFSGTGRGADDVFAVSEDKMPLHHLSDAISKLGQKNLIFVCKASKK